MAQVRISQPSNVHQDVALSNLSIAYAQDLARLVATQVFPEVTVDKQSDKFYIWARDFWHRSVMGRKTAGANAPRHGLGINTGVFTCEGFWLEYLLDKDVIANEDAAVDSERAAAEWLAYQAMLNREVKFSADFFVTGVWGTSTALTGVNKWDDFDGSNPILNARTAIQTIEKNTGASPNTLVVSAEVWDNGLVDHPLIIDRYKHSQKGIMTPELVAAVLGIERILVARAIRNTAVELAEATESYTGAYIFAKNALLLNVVAGVSLLQPAAGKSFIWKPNGLGLGIERYEDERADAEVLRIRDYFDQKITSAQYGYMYTGAVS